MSGKSSEVAALEYTTVKVPYEVLNKKFRQAQKIIDREISQLNAQIINISKLPTAELQFQAIPAFKDKLISFRKRYLECLQKEGGYAEKCLRRLEHLAEYTDSNANDKSEGQWRKKRLDKMLVDYFLRNSHYDTALSVVNSSGIEDIVDTDLFTSGRQIEQSLMEHNTAPCLQWCHENKSRLKKTKSTLEFNLHTQNFIELIRARDYMSAIAYARKHMVESEGMTKEKLQETMALLAFRPSTECSKYVNLFSEARWEALVSEFRSSNYDLHHLHSDSLLSTVLQSGLSAIKTHQCYSSTEKSGDCPVCNEPLNTLATTLPFSHCTQSRLICRISGEVMNEHNSPMMLPNGNVYGERALKEMMAADGIVTCPRTKDKFWLDQAQKVYVM